MSPKASGDRILGAVVATACVACCLPLVVAARSASSRRRSGGRRGGRDDRCGQATAATFRIGSPAGGRRYSHATTAVSAIATTASGHAGGSELTTTSPAAMTRSGNEPGNEDRARNPPVDDCREPDEQRNAGAKGDEHLAVERVTGMGDDLLDTNREPDDPEQHREMSEAVRVAHPDPDIPGRGVLELLLEPFLEPAEVGPPQQAGNQESQRGIGGQVEGPLVGRDGRACDDQRLAEGNDHEQRMSLGHVADVDVPRAPAGRLCREQVREDCQHPDQRSDRGICQRAHEDEREPDRRHAGPAPDPGCPRVVGPLHLDEDLEGRPRMRTTR